MATVRFTKRPNKDEAKLLQEFRAELEEYGDTGTYRADDLEDLKAVVEGVRAKRFKADSQTNNIVKSKENSMAKSIETKVEPIENEVKAESSSKGSDFSFLEEELVQRTYSGTETKTNNPYLGQDIPEATVKNPIEQMMDDERAESEEDSQNEETKEEGSKFSNPKMKDLDNKNKKKAANELVNLSFEAYKALHGLAANFTKVSEKKVAKLVSSGDIDPELIIQTEEGEVSFTGYITKYNEQVDVALTYDPEIEEQLREPLTNIYMKHDWGVTDEQMVIGVVVLDIAKKGAAVAQLKSYQSMILDGFKNATKREREITQPSVSPDVITKQAESSPKEKQKRTSSKRKSIQSAIAELSNVADAQIVE
jgi:hypothetical protein